MQWGRWYNVARMRLRSCFSRGRVDAELDKELSYHLERQVSENRAAGMTAGEARLAALRMFGGVSQVQEECREMRRTDYVDNLFQDLRYAVRMLGKSPAFTIVVVLTLALSIGANSAIFSVIDGVLLKPLPYPQADRLTRVFYRSKNFAKFSMNPWDFADFRARNRSFESFALYFHSDVQLSGAGEPVKLSAFQISAGYFRVLGIHPALGREFEFSEELPGNGNLVILSDRLWRRQFGADTAILGRKITLDARPYTVVGVMPPDIDHPGNTYKTVAYGDTVDAWYPFTFAGNPANRGSHFVEGIGRLRRGVTPQRAAADLNAIMAELATQHPGDRNWSIYTVPLFQEVVGPVNRLLMVLLGAVGMVLLIACVNTANLLLARSSARQREIAVRAALGAGRWRLVRQMLAESLLLAALGCGLGALLAMGGVRALVALLPAGFPRAAAIHVNGVVFAFTAAVGLLTGIVFGLVPALQSSRADLQQGLREGGRGRTAGARQTSLRSVLVVGEVGLACVLLVGAGVMLRSFLNLLNTNPGFQAQHVLTAELSLPQANYKTLDQISTFYRNLLAQVKSLPGVQAAGAGTDVPWTGYDENFGGFTIEGKIPPPNQGFSARFHAATPDYFRAAGIPLMSGRYLDERDAKGAPLTVIINQAMARKYWPNEDPVGKRIDFFEDKPKESDWYKIVGVVGDVKDTPESGGAAPAFWWPLAQQPFGFPNLLLVVRSTGDTAQLTRQLRLAVHELDPGLAVAHVRLLDQIASESFSTPRISLLLVGLFAALALTLAAIGIYGVVSYSVSQRMHEFGMRLALGASSWDVIRLVMRQGLVLTVVGAVLGLGAAIVAGRALDSMLYGVKASDPLTLVCVAAMAVVIAALACYPSARRATGADPIVALRAE
ncbi:MAG TPA: ABC transporter permease [Candidatus Sulfopaludibacter sp.]|jgi:predicted permease|nr:ABC transporter permease [Candidatus Sulfopaludibacter sp.]